MVYVDRIHGIVFRLETVAAVFFGVGFYGGGVVDKGDNDIAVFSGGGFADDDFVAVVNADIDHTLAAYIEHK